jgi:hypothetical protein
MNGIANAIRNTHQFLLHNESGSSSLNASEKIVNAKAVIKKLCTIDGHRR